MHVSKVVSRRGEKEYVSWLVRRSFRDDGKVRHETLANLSALPPAAIEAVRASLSGKALVAAGDGLRVVRSLPHGHVTGPAFSGQLFNGLIYAASCRFRYSLWTSCGVL
jgi:hypothetical protein